MGKKRCFTWHAAHSLPTNPIHLINRLSVISQALLVRNPFVFLDLSHYTHILYIPSVYYLGLYKYIDLDINMTFLIMPKYVLILTLFLRPHISPFNIYDPI